MAYTFNANITSKAAARLLIMNEISLEDYWQQKQAETLLDELSNLSVDEVLAIIDCIEPQLQIDSATLPQFGSLETLIRVPEIMVSRGMDCLSYTQLGFYLKGDLEAKQAANAKYGETHGKGACQLGFAVCHNSKICFGALTNAFNSIGSFEEQHYLAAILCFRIPVIQTLLNMAKAGRTNGFSPMRHLERSTQNRRAICVRMIFKELAQIGNPELSRRIENIYWDLDEEELVDVEI